MNKSQFYNLKITYILHNFTVLQKTTQHYFITFWRIKLITNYQ